MKNVKCTSSLVAIAKEISKRFSDQVKNVKYIISSLVAIAK